MTIETKKIEISEELKRKIDMVCRFTNTTPIIVNGGVKSIVGTNIAYALPHKIFIKNNLYLIFEECEDVFINSLNSKIKFKDLENYIKAN